MEKEEEEENGRRGSNLSKEKYFIHLHSSFELCL